MKMHHGYYFPDEETHFQAFMEKGDYQILQREMALGVCRALDIPLNVALDIGAHVGLWAKPLASVFNKVICFEPRAENVACLTKNLEGLNAEIHPVGLSDGTAQADVRPLDSFSIPEINFIKINVQGLELNVLRGGYDTIRRTMPIIICENHPERWQLNTAFTQLGYEKILRVTTHDIYVPCAMLLMPEPRQRIMRYFNDRKAYFEDISSRQ